MDEYKFPDEDDNVSEDKLDISIEGDDIDIEIVNDIPKEDRNRTPVTENVKQELENADDSEVYSDDIKTKFKEYKKVWHEERRAKEQAYREQQEALQIAQRILDENNKLKEMLKSGEEELISTYKDAANLEVDKAKKKYKDAYDSGDSDALLEAQEELISAKLKLDKTKKLKPALQTEENSVQIQQSPTQQQVQTDPKVEAWVAKNKWFIDPRKRAMRMYAEGVHAELVNTYGSAIVGTDDYFKSIDEDVQRRFPEEFAKDETNDKSQRQTKLSTVVAPAKRSTSSKRVVLTKTQVAISKKLGLTPEQYAREVTKLEA